MMPETIKLLVVAFLPHVADSSTLDELKTMISDRQQWRRGRELFQRIRQKTLDAARRRDKTAECQYLFEEVCAKTLYNLSGGPAPFDQDTPEWIGHNASKLAQRLGVDEVVAKILAA